MASSASVVAMLRQAIQGSKLDVAALSKMLLGRSHDEIEELKRLYQEQYGSSLAEDVRRRTLGETQLMFGTVLDAPLPDNQIGGVDERRVESDVKELHKRSCKRGEKSKMVFAFCNILIRRSPGHVAAVIQRYEKMYSRSLKEVIKKANLNADVERGLLHIADGERHKHERAWHNR